MNTLFRSTIAFAVLGGARAAYATCFITGLRPDEAMLPTMHVGQEFSFVATNDCLELRFHVAGKLSKIPMSGKVGSDKEATYTVVLTEREWNMVSDGRDELTWSITATTSDGETMRVSQTNTIDHDLHFELSAAEAEAKITGEAPSDEAGTSVSSAGDVDGDGNDDVLIGAPGKGSARGAAYVVAGPVSGNVDLLLAAFLGAEEDEAGASVSGVGDVDEDGYDDLLIGAPGNNGNVGAAYLLYGPVRGRPTPADADVKLVGEGPGEDLAGFSVSGTGDVNGDDVPDLLIGSFWHSDTEPRTGAAYVVYGSTLNTVTDPTFDLSSADVKLLGPTREGDIGLGVNVARAGDVDGDGMDDLAVGTDWNDEFEGPAGASWTLSNHSMPHSMEIHGDGPVKGLVEFVPESEADSASAIAGAGDVDHDGYDDLLIGASDNVSGGLRAGKAYLIPGSLIATEKKIHLADAPAQFVGELPGDLAGDHVSGAGDVNGDGNDDILIGAYGNNDGVGAAYLLLGPVSGTKELSRADVKLVGEEAHDRAGFGISSAGDVDDDGFDDVLVGAPNNSDAAGSTYVFGGAGLSLLTAGSP